MSTAASAVRWPGTTSTSGMTWGGWNGCPTSTRSGCRAAPRAIVVGSRPEELEASTTPSAAASSSSPNRVCLRSSRSGPFSCTNPAAPAAAPALSANVRFPTGSGPSWPGNGPSAARSARSRSSAPGAGSKARTCRPRDRNSAVQPTPITPVPTTATVPIPAAPPVPSPVSSPVPAGSPGALTPASRRRGGRTRRARWGRRARRGRRHRRRPRRAGSASRGPPASCRCGCAARPAPPRPGPGRGAG